MHKRNRPYLTILPLTAPGAKPHPQSAGKQRIPNGGSVAALFVADLPTWAFGRLDPQLPLHLPILALSGERVVGANMPARKAGVRPGEHYARAMQLCPQALAYPHDEPAAQAAWEAVVATAYTFTPRVEVAHPGLLFAADLNPSEAEALAQVTQSRVGLAPSRGTAHLAALAAPQGSARVVRAELEFIAQVGLVYLRGMGFSPELTDRLELFGIHHLGDIHRYRLSKAQLKAQFGAEGERLYAIAHGLLDAPVPRYREPEEILERIEFEVPVVEPWEFEGALVEIVSRAARHLGTKVVWVVAVSVFTPLGCSTRRRVLGAGSQDPGTLCRVARLTLADAHVGGVEIQALEVRLGQLSLPPARQGDLFGSFSRPDVQDAIELVDRRFAGSIKRVVLKAGTFPEDSYDFIPVGPSQDRRVGDGRRVS